MPFARSRAAQGAVYQTIVVKSAAELLARVKADLVTIDLLVLDLRLPHAPGVESADDASSTPALRTS